jgi:RND family efflux transporter MFP subunit
MIAAATIGCQPKNPPVVELPPAVVDVSQPLERTVTDYQVFTARTQAVQSVDLKARVTGYLTKIKFKDGDMVKEGETLFQIDDRPYKAALDQAKAALEVAKAALVKTQADYDIGLKVQKDNPGAISEQEIVRRLGARDEAKGNIDEAKASLETAQLNFDWCSVTSPLTGRTTRHLVDVGNMVNQNVTNLVNIVSLKPMWAYINVDQTTAKRVQTLVRAGKLKAFREGNIPVGMAVGVGSESSFPTPGVIDYVSNQLDPSTGTIQMRATFPNDNEQLVAGVFARIRVPISDAHQALLINDRAVGTDQGKKFILVVTDEDKVESRFVEIGQLFDSLREVMRYLTVTEPGPDGKDVTKQVEVLKPTDRVIVNGLQRVRPNDKVVPKDVDMVTLLPVPGADKKPAK